MVSADIGGIVESWPHYLTTALLVLLRLSGLFVFAPVFSSAAISARVKAGFAIALTALLAPVVALVPGAVTSLDVKTVLGELGVGLVFGLSLSMMNEALVFAGALLGMQFSFSLVNLMDPNSKVETPVLGQMLGWLGILVLLGSGLDRTLLAAMVRSFCVVPVGGAAIQSRTGLALVEMGSGIFLAGLQLAAPVIAAALTVEVTVAMVARLSPQLPAMVVSVPVKTLACYVVLIASLALWPVWIERHFIALLDMAGKLMVTS